MQHEKGKLWDQSLSLKASFKSKASVLASNHVVMVPGHLRSECPLGWVEDHGVHFSKHLIISAAFLRADGLAPGLGALGQHPKLGEEKGFPSSTAFKAATTSASPHFPCRHGHQSQPGSGNWKLPASPMSIPEFPFHLFIFSTLSLHHVPSLKSREMYLKEELRGIE